MRSRRALVVIAATSSIACSSLLGVEDLPAKAKDAGVDAPPPPPSFCQKLQTPVTFCRDFDDGTPYDEGVEFWEAPPPNAILRVDNQSSMSPPASLLSEVANSSENARRAYILYRYDFPATNIRVAFDLRIEEATLAPNKNAGVVSLRFGADTTEEHGLGINVTSTSAHLEEHVGNNQWVQYPFSIQPKVGTWSRIEVQIQTTPRHVTAWIDGQQTVDSQLDGTWHSAPLIFAIGTFWITDTAGAVVRVRHDNVVLDLK